MKMLLATLGLAVLLSPSLALADNDAPPTTAQMAQFQQMHQKMEQLHAQARSQMLGALTPAHKTALANIVGQLAVSPNPDPEAAARQINGLLSPGESASIVRIHTAFKAQVHSLMQSVHAQMHQGSPEGPERMKEAGEQRRPIDAGHILLHLSMPGPHGMMMHHE